MTECAERHIKPVAVCFGFTVQTICPLGFCKNGGNCTEIGCHKYCICQNGYGGDDCGTGKMQKIYFKSTKFKLNLTSPSPIADLLEITLVSLSSLTVDAGDIVTVKLNISSIDGPVTVKIWNSREGYTPAYDVASAIGETEIQLGQMWGTRLWTEYRLGATPEKNGTSYKKEVSVRIFVNGKIMDIYLR